MARTNDRSYGLVSGAFRAELALVRHTARLVGLGE